MASRQCVYQEGDLVVEVESVSAAFTCRNRMDCDECPVVCCLRVPNRLLQEWHEQYRSDSTSMIELLNVAVRGRVVTVDVHCERLQQHLYRRAGEIARKAGRTKPYRARQSYLSKTTIFDVYRGETLDAAALMEELEDTILELESEDIAEWTRRREGYEETITLLREQLRAARDRGSSGVNTGLPLNQVAERQRRRKLSLLKSSTEKALWFVESFGLDVESVTMRDSAGSSVVLNYTDPPPPTLTTPVPPPTLTTPAPPPTLTTPAPPSDHALAQTLYLLERFGVSDEFYHELSMINPSLSRYVLIFS